VSRQPQPRIPWVDALRGLAILLVVFAHTELPPSNWIYGFHVPLFFVLSGLLCARSTGRSLPALATARARTLLLPYLALSALGISCLLLQARLRGTEGGLALLWTQARACVLALRGTSPFHGDLWFLPCLFLTELVHQALGLGLPRLRRLLPALCAGAVILGLHPQALLPSPLPWGLDLLPTTLCFFSLGHLLQSEDWVTAVQDNAGWIAPAGFILTLGGVAFNGRVDLYHGLFGEPSIFLLSAAGGALSLLACAPLLARIPYLATVGRHTLAILAFHHWYGFGIASFLCRPLLALLPENSLLAQSLHGLLLFVLSLGLLGLALLAASRLRRRPAPR